MEFKVGDKVIISSRYGKAINTVSKITPTGRIKVDGSYFDSRGYQIGGDIWNRNHIILATDEMINQIEEDFFIRKTIQNMKEIKSLAYEDAKQISEILKKYL